MLNLQLRSNAQVQRSLPVATALVVLCVCTLVSVSATRASAQLATQNTPRSGASVVTTSDSVLPKSAAPPEAPFRVAVHGEVRLRSEWDRPMSNARPDLFTLMRSRLGAQISASQSARLVLEVQDSRVLGDNSATARQTFDLHQGYIELDGAARNADVYLRAGRQEIALANERLVGAVGWSNLGRTFDGIRVGAAQHRDGTSSVTTSQLWTADAFVTTLEERGRHFSAQTVDTTYDHILGGLFLTRPVGTLVTAQVTALADVGANFRSYRNARRGTVDVRLLAPRVGALRVELEGAVQRGGQDVLTGADTASQTIAAWLVGVRVGMPPSTSRRLSVGVGADLLSGDATPGNGAYSAFNTLYGTNHALYGTIDIFVDPARATKDRGLQDLFVTTDVKLSSTLRMRTDLHHMGASTGVNRDLGWELDVIAPVRIAENVTLDAGYSAFRAGSAAAAIGLGATGATQHWAFLQIRTQFRQ